MAKRMLNWVICSKGPRGVFATLGYRSLTSLITSYNNHTHTSTCIHLYIPHNVIHHTQVTYTTHAYVLCTMAHTATDFFPGWCLLATQSTAAITPLDVWIIKTWQSHWKYDVSMCILLLGAILYIRWWSISRVIQRFNCNCCGLFSNPIFLSHYNSCVYIIIYSVWC